MHVLKIDRAVREVALDNGFRQPYEGLALATGGTNRRLPISGGDLPDISSLRSVDDAYKFADSLAKSQSVLVVGAGFVGLEIAAASRLSDRAVTVIEREQRVLARAVSPLLSGVYARLHRERAVQLELGADVAEVLSQNGKATGVRLTDGRIFEADLIVAGIGLIPNDKLAREAGYIASAALSSTAVLAPRTPTSSPPATAPPPPMNRACLSIAWNRCRTRSNRRDPVRRR